MGPNKYIVDIYNFPITTYSPEYLQQLEQTSFKKISEPKFSRILNKKVNQEEVKKGKRLVKQK